METYINTAFTWVSEAWDYVKAALDEITTTKWLLIATVLLLLTKNRSVEVGKAKYHG